MIINNVRPVNSISYMIFNPGNINRQYYPEKEDKELGKSKSEWEYEGGMHTSQCTHTPWMISSILVILPMAPAQYIQFGCFHGFQTYISDCLLDISTGRPIGIPNSTYSTSLLLLPCYLYPHLPRCRLESWEHFDSLFHHPLPTP